MSEQAPAGFEQLSLFELLTPGLKPFLQDPRLLEYLDTLNREYPVPDSEGKLPAYPSEHHK